MVLYPGVESKIASWKEPPDYLGLLPFLLSETNPTTLSDESNHDSLLSQRQLFTAKQNASEVHDAELRLLEILSI